jgi:hypothetical protein
MPERTDQPQGQPTPVTEDAHATVPQLLDRAAQDYTTAQAAREQQSHRAGR